MLPIGLTASGSLAGFAHVRFPTGVKEVAGSYVPFVAAAAGALFLAYTHPVPALRTPSTLLARPTAQLPMLALWFCGAAFSSTKQFVPCGSVVVEAARSCALPRGEMLVKRNGQHFALPAHGNSGVLGIRSWLSKKVAVEFGSLGESHCGLFLDGLRSGDDGPGKPEANSSSDPGLVRLWYGNHVSLPALPRGRSLPLYAQGARGWPFGSGLSATALSESSPSGVLGGSGLSATALSKSSPSGVLGGARSC